MQILHAGSRQLVLLELENNLIREGAEQAGFECDIQESDRHTVLDLSAVDRAEPLLLFDAADPANTGWFSRCQFYVDARSGAVLQIPFLIANHFDSRRRPEPARFLLQINRELPHDFRLPGRRAVSERVLYSVLFNFLEAMTSHGVGLCGKGFVLPTMRR